MTWNEIRGQWRELDGKIRQQWGRLTDDDMARIKGRREVLIGRLQALYDLDQQEAAAQVERFRASIKAGTAANVDLTDTVH